MIFHESLFQSNSSLYLEVQKRNSVEGYTLSPPKTRAIAHKTRRYRRDTSMSQPFTILAKSVHERLERYPDNDTPSIQRHLHVESTDRPVAIRYLACHPHLGQVVCTIMFMTCYHEYTILNRLGSYVIQDHHSSCHDPTPHRPFIILHANIHQVLLDHNPFMLH